MKISVITVCFNSSNFIRQTIESVLGQDYSDFEYVLIDGGSSDGTVDLIKHYADQDQRIVWSTEPDQGISDAMNKGAETASGEIITHLHSDDYYAHPEVLSRVADCFRAAPSTIWLTGGLSFVAEDGSALREVRVRNYSFRRLLRGNIILHPATYIRRDTFHSAGQFDTHLKYCMDYDLFLRLGSMGPPLVLDEQLACFRIHADSCSVSRSEQAYEEEYQVRMRYLQKTGRASLYYKLDYQLKRRLNRLFYKGLLNAGRKQ